MRLKFIRSIISAAIVCSALVGCKDKEPCEEHTWDAGEITTAPTDTSDGIKTYTCSVCGEKKTEIVPKTGTSTCNHIWDNGQVVTAATDTSDGIKKYTCTVCGESKLEIIPKGGENAEKFTVTYDGNGGTGTAVLDLNQYAKGERVVVKSNTFTAPEGKEFINWNTAADGSGGYYNANSTFKIYENVTLYAQWLDEEKIDFDENTEFAIKVNAPEGVNCTLSHQKAKKDTEVTLTISLAAGITLVGDPTSSQTSLSKARENVYTFVMPQNNVTINIKATIDGDVALSGDVTARLVDTDNDGIYTADVACDDKTSYEFTYIVKDSNGVPKRLASTKLDETRCDASITFSTGKDNELVIDGGCTYTFCYDSNEPDFNCYVVRKSVDVLPMNSKTLYSLFAGSMRSNTTVHPQGLNSISYKKTVSGDDAEQGYKRTNEEYLYTKISETESFAYSLDKLTNKKSYVYKNIDTAKKVYSLVNTYTKDGSAGNNEQGDNVWNQDPYSLDSENKYYQPYSAKKDIVDNHLFIDYENYNERYQITSREAYRNINMAAHYSSALEYEIYQSIRGDFDGEAIINAANKEGSNFNIVSTVMGGGFQVDVQSQLEYNHEENGEQTADVTQQYAYVYSVTFKFLSNGDLYSLDYVENYYTKSNWDFAKHAPKAGVTPVTIKIEAEYGYTAVEKTRSQILGDFDPSIYFVSSIDSLSFYNSMAGAKQIGVSVMNYDDSLDIVEYGKGGKNNPVVDSFTYSPSTALDAWQYGFIDSSDKGVADKTPWGPKTVGVGTATVTFGNHLTNENGPTKNVNILVSAGGVFNSLCFNVREKGFDSYDYYDSDDYVANKVQAFAGRTMKYCIMSSGNTGCPISYYIAFDVLKNKEGKIVYGEASSPYFNVVNSVGTVNVPGVGECAKVVGQELKLDFNTAASNAITSKTSVELYLLSDFYNPNYPSPSTVTIEINPALDPLVGSKYVTTRPYDSDPTKKCSEGIAEFFDGGIGKMTEIHYELDGSVDIINVFNFTYRELNSGVIEASLTSIQLDRKENSIPDTTYSYKLIIGRTAEGILGIYFGTDDVDIFGLVKEVDEGENDYGREAFMKVVA